MLKQAINDLLLPPIDAQMQQTTCTPKLSSSIWKQNISDFLFSEIEINSDIKGIKLSKNKKSNLIPWTFFFLYLKILPFTPGTSGELFF